MFKRPISQDIETEIVIIGAGVSGITAAQILAKGEIDFWLLGSPYESQLAKAGVLEDVTTIPEETVGLKHIEQEIQKTKDQGIQHKTSMVTELNITDTLIEVKTKYQKFLTQNVLITTGCKQGKIGFEGEQEYFRKGISDCAVCDFPLYRDKTVAVLGNHKYTLKSAEFLKDHMKNVILLWYKEDFNQEVSEDISIYDNVERIVASGSDIIEKLKFESNGEIHSIEIDGLFVEGKPIPATQFIQNSGIEMDRNYIKINQSYETNIPHVFAAGDVTGKTDNFEDARKAGEEVANILLNLYS